jgi:hypothetical protein
LEAGDPGSFLVHAENTTNGLRVVLDNPHALKDRGIYEQCLVFAYTDCRVNHHWLPESQLRGLFEIADREKLLAAGDPFPNEGEFRLYRGIAGHGRARRPLGISWTSSLAIACWFANRLKLPNPAVVTSTVSASEVWAVINARGEQEFIVRPASYTKLAMSLSQLRDLAERARLHG